MINVHCSVHRHKTYEQYNVTEQRARTHDKLFSRLALGLFHTRMANATHDI